MRRLYYDRKVELAILFLPFSYRLNDPATATSDGELKHRIMDGTLHKFHTLTFFIKIF